MKKKNIPKESGEISRREFLKDAGLVVGGAAIGSAVILAACGEAGETATETVTKTATDTVTTTAGAVTETATVTTTAGAVTETDTVTTTAGAVTSTVTETVSKFVCPIDGQEFDSLAALQAHFEAAHPEAPAAANVIKFTLNGYEYEVQVESRWTLQHLIHDRLGWTGIKDMCTGYGACGSCTVIMDGRPILSCLTLAEDANGHVIETAEGVAKRNFALIEAYDVNQCSQCGYCTPGFVVTVQALIDKKAKPTAEDITEILAGNLCR